MSLSSDISSLFKQFGGRPDQYQEISKADTQHASLERWPSIARAENSSRAIAEEKAPELFSSRGSVPLAEAVAAPVIAASEPPVAVTVEPVKAALPTARSGESLQSLLAKLAEEGRNNAAVDDVVAPLQMRARPQLSQIKIIAVVSAKGGVGKSTMAANLAAALHNEGRPVLAVDLDPQNALHHHFEVAAGQECDAVSEGIAHPDQDWKAIGISSSTGVLVLPHGGVDEDQRRAFELQLANDPQWLAHKLSDLQLVEEAIVVIDTPPGPSLYLQQALAVANIALVVSLSDAASYTALPLIEGLIKTYAAKRHDFIGPAYLINQFDSSLQLSKDITQIMLAQLGKQVIGVVHRDQSISEALAYNRNVMEYSPNGRGCFDVMNCAKTLLGRLAADTRIEQPA